MLRPWMEAEDLWVNGAGYVLPYVLGLRKLVGKGNTDRNRQRCKVEQFHKIRQQQR